MKTLIQKINRVINAQPSKQKALPPIPFKEQEAYKVEQAQQHPYNWPLIF